MPPPSEPDRASRPPAPRPPAPRPPGLRPQAAGPAAQAQALRSAYLQVLKLCLCDLAGASTREVRWTSDKRVFWRTLTDAEQLRHRRQGKDWPLDGLTMVGLDRLDDLQACVETVVADGVPGDLIEAGAWRGGASILIRATLDTLGQIERTLWVADSFQGFPPPADHSPAADRQLEADMGRIDHLAPALDTVKEYFARFGLSAGVNFVPGFFEDTMAGLRGHGWSLVRLDADTYHATKLTLRALYPGLADGGYLIVDDYFHPYLPESCRRAVDDFRAEHGIVEPIEQIDWNGARWRKRRHPESLRELDAGPGRSPAAPSGGEPGPTQVIPSDRELQLQDEVTALKEQLRRAQGELAHVAERPAVRLVGRLRRVARRR